MELKTRTHQCVYRSLARCLSLEQNKIQVETKNVVSIAVCIALHSTKTSSTRLEQNKTTDGNKKNVLSLIAGTTKPCSMHCVQIETGRDLHQCRTTGARSECHWAFIESSTSSYMTRRWRPDRGGPTAIFMSDPSIAGHFDDIT